MLADADDAVLCMSLRSRWNTCKGDAVLVFEASSKKQCQDRCRDRGTGASIGSVSVVVLTSRRKLSPPFSPRCCRRSLSLSLSLSLPLTQSCVVIMASESKASYKGRILTSHLSRGAKHHLIHLLSTCAPAPSPPPHPPLPLPATLLPPQLPSPAPPFIPIHIFACSQPWHGPSRRFDT